MINFDTQKESSLFNTKEVYLLTENEDDIIDIGSAFSMAGIKCYLYDTIESSEQSLKSMLLIDNEIISTKSNEELKEHFVFSYSTKSDTVKKGTVGHIRLPINIEDINQMVNTCHYEALVEQKDEQNKALEKISSLGRFTGSLVHDLNNYNTICMTAFDGLKLVNRRKFQDEKIDFLVSKGLKGCKMINSLSTKYRRFMQVDSESEKAYYSLNKMVNEAFSLMEKDLNQYGITFKTEISRTVSLLCSETTFVQTIVNLISNAIFEIKNLESPWISIKARNKKSEIHLYIIDSGNGIPKEIQSKIFDPLFSTKSKEEGTGFGLSFCKRELENMGMDLRYIEHENTAFAIDIPLNVVKVENN